MRPSTLFIVIAAALLCACGGGHAPAGPAVPPSTGKSYVVWPVSNGTVTVYRFDGGTRGAAVGTTQTDKAGAFELHLSAPATGPLLVVVSSGSYSEPATGTPVFVDGYELSAAVPAKVRAAGDAIAGLLVSPVSHLVVHLAAKYVRSGSSIDSALSLAQSLLNSHFGGIDWSSLSLPPDLANVSASSVVQLNDATKAALVLAGLSAEAKNLAQAKSLTPGGPLNSLSLLAALAADLNGDGFFDGYGAIGVRLTVPPGASSTYTLDGQTVRSTLGQGIANFLSNNRNSSRIALADAQALVTAIATDNNPQLFRDAGGSIDITPPTIGFLSPAANAFVHGQVTVEANATDNTAMGTFAFTAPSALAATQAASENSGKTMRLKTFLDVSAMPDGPLAISVAATDAASNTSTASLTIRVANHGPLISVSFPSSGQTLKGIVTIAATATGRNGATVTGLSLVNPPPGTGPDTLPAADALSITWDTRQTLEGPLTLHFQATDNLGGVTDAYVAIIVDNVPFGIIDVTLSAGAPISGAVVTVVAVDNLSGTVASTIGPNAGVLGQCSATNNSGFLSCTLSVENYQGPVQVRAGGSGLNYIDPSDGNSVISIPQSFAFTSLIANYKTGDHVVVPLTLWTAMADAAALAYLAGVDRAAAIPHPLVDSLVALDPLFNKHLTSMAWDLRGTIPVSLTTTTQSLRDVVYAALPDVALNQIARSKSVAAAVTPGVIITAITIAQLLTQDAKADGQFDGRGAGGAQLQTAGNPPQMLNASWLRYAMAQALDEWFKTTQNKTGLTNSDLQNAGVFDTVASDTSILFPSSVVPQPYDNTPPTMTLSARFTNGGQTDHAPVAYAAQQLIAGTLNLTADASDPSGVASLVVQYQPIGSASWTTISPDSGSTIAHVLAHLDTTTVPNGPLIIRLSSCDRAVNSNCGTQLFQFVVDNTPPTITVVQPAAANLAYSSVIPAHITVWDNQAVASVAETSLNIPLTNNNAGAWTGSWSIPSGQADGTLSLTYKACDLVFNCRQLVIPFVVDRTPPSVAVVIAPPRYTNNQTVSLTAAATDGNGSGVSAVFAKNLTTQGPTVPGVFNTGSGTWTFSTVALSMTQGDNNIAVYGIDNALDGAGTSVGANSGAGRGAPYQVTVQSLFDKTAPAIVVSTSQSASYYDERAMTLVQVGASPNLLGAWAYDPSPTRNTSFASLLPVDISTSLTPVHKTTQRLALGASSPNLADLLNAKGSGTNTPYVSFSVPFTSTTDSPITGASYGITVTCTGCPTFAAATGQLVLDTTQPGGTYRYVLPISTEFIPALGQVTSLATVNVNAAATDAAGNAGALSPVASFKFALDAPPIVALSKDTNYPNEGDPWAVTSFKIANNTYANSFSAATASTPAEGERLERWVVYNPGASYGLTLQLVVDPSDAAHSTPAVENWEGWNDNALTPGYVNGAGPWCFGCGTYGNPCVGNYAGWQWLTGGYARCPSSFVRNNPNMTYAPTKQTSAPLTLHVYRAANDGLTLAGDTQVTSNNAYVVPAASGSYVGMAVIFVGRTSASVIRYTLVGAPGPGQLSWNPSNFHYESDYASVTVPPTSTTSVDCLVGSATCYNNLADWTKRLDFAQSNVYGAFSWTANQFSPGTTTVIGAATPANTTVFSAVIGQ